MKPTLVLFSLWMVFLVGGRPVKPGENELQQKYRADLNDTALALTDSSLAGVDVNGNGETPQREADAYLQGKENLSVPGRQSRPAVEELMHLVDDLKIEYRADIELNAIENGKITNRKLAEEIAHSLFNDAEGARYPYPFVVTKRNVDTRDTAVAWSLSAFHLDALSIQLRAVQALTSLSSSKPLQQFQSIHLAVPPTSCKTTLVPELSSYYAMFTGLANSAVHSGSKMSDDLFFWIFAQLQGMSSAQQLAPMASSLANLRIGANEFKTLADAYSTRVAQLSATDRELAYMQKQQSLADGIRALASKLREESWPIAPLFQSYRVFLENSAAQPSCSDTTANWAEVLKSFNGLIDEYKPNDVGKMDLSDLTRSTQTGGRADVQLPPDMTPEWAVLGKLDEARPAGDASGSTGEVQDSSGWESAVDAGLKALDEIEPSRFDCYACASVEKSEVLYFYFDEVPDKRWKERILSYLVRSLADQKTENEAPLEWLFRVEFLLNAARKASAEQEQELRRVEKAGVSLTGLPSVLGAEIRRAMMQSGDNTLSLYAHADEVLQNPYVMPPLPPPPPQPE